ncbi:MAG: helix-turn-helix transcriptional regulator [Acidimicrobiales bacterium]
MAYLAGRAAPVAGRAALAGASEPGVTLTDSEFSAAVTAVTAAFGDPTRRRMYLFVRDHPEGVTASQIAEHFELHSNVARHHLDKLSAAGYLSVFVTRSADAGAGRPSKHYRVSGRQTGVEGLRREDDLLVLLLGRALALVPSGQAELMAEQVGEEYGRRLAGQIDISEESGPKSFRTALHAIADALTAHGFAANAEDRGDTTAVVAEHCPFGEAATQHPVICAVDRGMVRGLLSGLCGDDAQDPIPVVLSSRARGDDTCAALV